jgi:Tat protein secretion system quality control protein TatD with DNase activity
MKVIKAVPEDRLLIESDQHSPAHGEEDLRRICEIVAEVRFFSAHRTFTAVPVRRNHRSVF